MTLAEFLLARIAEDEEDAEHWRYTSAGGFGSARLLAECDAKRRIVESHEDCGYGTGYCDDGGHGWNWPGGPGGCSVLGYLALPYAAHPQYDPAWRP